MPDVGSTCRRLGELREGGPNGSRQRDIREPTAGGGRSLHACRYRQLLLRNTIVNETRNEVRGKRHLSRPAERRAAGERCERTKSECRRGKRVRRHRREKTMAGVHASNLEWVCAAWEALPAFDGVRLHSLGMAANGKSVLW